MFRTEWITPQLTDTINKISKNIPNFYAGRYDIRFDNIEDFKEGRNFKILELNCTMGYDLRIPTERSYIKGVYYLLSWIGMRLLIGFINTISFNGINILDFPFTIYYAVHDALKCNDWERLFQSSST